MVRAVGNNEARFALYNKTKTCKNCIKYYDFSYFHHFITFNYQKWKITFLYDIEIPLIRVAMSMSDKRVAIVDKFVIPILALIILAPLNTAPAITLSRYDQIIVNNEEVWWN